MRAGRSGSVSLLERRQGCSCLVNFSCCGCPGWLFCTVLLLLLRARGPCFEGFAIFVLQRDGVESDIAGSSRGIDSQRYQWLVGEELDLVKGPFVVMLRLENNGAVAVESFVVGGHPEYLSYTMAIRFHFEFDRQRACACWQFASYDERVGSGGRDEINFVC